MTAYDYEVHQDIKKAIDDIGYINPNITIINHGLERYLVKLDNEYFGIWDSIKKTFVD